jgi:hypothetical protein
MAKSNVKKYEYGGPVPKKSKSMTDMGRNEMGKPVTPKQKAESLKGFQKSVDYPGRPKMKSGGSTSNFAKLAPPYNKATFADKIAGAKGVKPKMKMGGSCGTPRRLKK